MSTGAERSDRSSSTSLYVFSQFFGGVSDPGSIFGRFRGEVDVGDFLFVGVVFMELLLCSGVTDGDDALFDDGVDITNSSEVTEVVTSALLSFRGEVLLWGVSMEVALRSGVTAGDNFDSNDGSFCCDESWMLRCVKYLDVLLEIGWDECIDDDVCSSNL